MSFICGRCGNATPHRIPQHKVVTATRPQTYKNTVYKEDEDGVGGVVEVSSKGTEIVREIALCPGCKSEAVQ